MFLHGSGSSRIIQLAPGYGGGSLTAPCPIGGISLRTGTHARMPTLGQILGI